MSILERIIEVKQSEVQQLKKRQQQARNRLNRSTFTERVMNDSHMSIIAEIKRASPSKGLINTHVEPVEQARKYEAAGAQAISVLTDQPFFKGSFADLKAVSEAVTIPVLCKDFIIDPVQIDCAAEHGATMILLIVAALTDEQLNDLYAYATERNIEVLCEVHDTDEYERARAIGFEIIGVNNRNLHTFEVDLTTTKKIAAMDRGKTNVLISESGMKTTDDVEFVQQAGARAILVGETFMRTDDVTKAFSTLRVKH